MSPVSPIPDVRENTSSAPKRDDVEPLPHILPSALHPRAYRGETTLDILVREHPDLHLQAMAWLG